MKRDQNKSREDVHFPEKDYKKTFRISAYMKEKGVFQEIILHCETSR